MTINNVVDLELYPLENIGSPDGRRLVDRCVSDLEADGMFNLPGFVRPQAIAKAIAEVRPVIDTASFTHRRRHNIYFKSKVDGLADDHPSLRQVETVNHTICGDQIPGSIVKRIYDWPALPAFLAKVMGKSNLYPMADPLAGANVMEYRDGEALNWHFDRSEFTTTLLLQAPQAGGEFEYRTALRTDTDPNYAGVANLLAGSDPAVRRINPAAGTLNVFRGKNTAHRVTAIGGDTPRIIAVYSYFEQSGRMFSAEERVGFYGRAS